MDEWFIEAAKKLEDRKRKSTQSRIKGSNCSCSSRNYESIISSGNRINSERVSSKMGIGATVQEEKENKIRHKREYKPVQLWHMKWALLLHEEKLANINITHSTQPWWSHLHWDTGRLTTFFILKIIPDPFWLRLLWQSPQTTPNLAPALHCKV